MLLQLERHFQKIGADLRIVTRSDSRFRPVPTIAVDVIEERRGELFEIRIRDRDIDRVDLSVLQVSPTDRHLVLLSKVAGEGGGILKDHFLCGHDERHLFVASVQPTSTVAAAKASLKPPEVRGRDVGLSTEKANRRKTEHFRRQGEWFFVPVDLTPHPNLIRRDERLVRGNGSKPHIAQFAFREGGESVKVCDKYPNGVTLSEYSKLIRLDPRAAHWGWRDMQRDAALYVTGSIRHADHATIVLNGWHRVLMNREAPTRGAATVAFLD
jgi:hypothetical protein